MGLAMTATGVTPEIVLDSFFIVCSSQLYIEANGQAKVEGRAPRLPVLAGGCDRIGGQ